MKVFDAHCDALLKLWKHPDLDFTVNDERLQVSLPEMDKGNIGLQVFAIFVPEHLPRNAYFHTALEMIGVFRGKVANRHLFSVSTKAELDSCVYQGNKGAILFVEGAHPLEGSLVNLQTLYLLGVRGIGLTWNFQNEVASGCLEPNPGGLTLFGRKVVSEMNRLGMLVDVSHVAEPGFWDALGLSSSPVIVSHANVKALCNHPRNLSDEQILALASQHGVMGLTFFPPFYTDERRSVTIDDLLRHLDYVCSLAGADCVGFGSDFDGIDQTFADLDRPRAFTFLTEELLKRYKEVEVQKFLFENWLRVFRTVLQ